MEKLKNDEDQPRCGVFYAYVVQQLMWDFGGLDEREAL